MSEFRDFTEEFARLLDRMNKIFGSVSGEADRPELMNEVEWVPPLDVLENKDDIIVRADIPGTSPDEIDLSISGDILHIKGERKLEIERDDENYHIIERGYGKFDRRINLPTSVDMNSIKASYKNGVLTVRLPKLYEERIKEVKVDLGDSQS